MKSLARAALIAVVSFAAWPARADAPSPLTAASLNDAEELVSIDDAFEPAVDWGSAVATSMLLGAGIAAAADGETAKGARWTLIGLRVVSRRIANRVYRRPDLTRRCVAVEPVSVCLGRAVARARRLRLVESATNFAIFAALSASLARAHEKDDNFILTLATTAAITLYDLYPTATERLAARVAPTIAVPVEPRGAWGGGLSVRF